MRNDPLSRALDICLRQMQSGASLEEALGLFPQLADELRPLLKSAQMARQLGSNIQVPKAAQARSRAAFLEAAQSRRQGRPGIFSVLFSNKFALVSLVLILVLFLGSLTTVAVSAQSLPGDPLYGIKLATERTRLLLVDNQGQKIKLEQSFDHERVQEVEALILQSRSQKVDFAGDLTQMQDNTWTIGGIRVTLTPQTEMIGDFKLDYYVHVQGNLQPDGAVIASSLQIQKFDISGKIRSIAGDLWIINDMTITITPQTIMNGTPAVGNQAHVSAILVSGGHMQATQIEVLDSQHNATQPLPATDIASPLPATPTQSTTVVASPTSHPTDTSEPEDTLEPTEGEHEGEDATEIPKATRTESPEYTPEPTEVHHEDHTPEPTEIEHEDSTATPTQINEATATPKPTESEDGEKRVGPTPTPSQTIHSSPTPEPTEIFSPTETPEVTNTPDSPTEVPEFSPTPTPTNDEHD